MSRAHLVATALLASGCAGPAGTSAHGTTAHGGGAARAPAPRQELPARSAAAEHGQPAAPGGDGSDTPSGELAEALQRRAHAAGDAEGATGLLLPTEWPTTSGRAVLFVYRVEPLPTGIVAYAVHGPTHAVEVDVGTGAATPRTLMHKSTAPALGRLHDAPLHDAAEAHAHASDARQHASERAVLEVIAGRTAAERGALLGYCDWLDSGAAVAADGARYAPSFFAWLACPAAGSH